MICNLADPPFRTIQGEGLFSGTPSVFVRFSGCNLRCRWKSADGSETICDTPYSSHRPEATRMEIGDLIKEIDEVIRRLDHLVITGGEPTLHVDQVSELAQYYSSHHAITMETNGSKAVSIPGITLFSVSPKLPSSGNINFDPEGKAVLELHKMNPNAHFQLKFVVNSEDDLEIVEKFSNRMPWGDRMVIMLMPQGISADQLNEKLPWIAEKALFHGFMVTDRLHIRMFGNKRGT